MCWNAHPSWEESTEAAQEAIDEGLYVARAVSELIRDWKGETEGSN